MTKLKLVSQKAQTKVRAEKVKILAQSISCLIEAEEERLRYPPGTIINGVNVGGKWMPDPNKKEEEKKGRQKKQQPVADPKFAGDATTSTSPAAPTPEEPGDHAAEEMPTTPEGKMEKAKGEIKKVYDQMLSGLTKGKETVEEYIERVKPKTDSQKKGFDEIMKSKEIRQMIDSFAKKMPEGSEAFIEGAKVKAEDFADYTKKTAEKAANFAKEHKTEIGLAVVAVGAACVVGLAVGAVAASIAAESGTAATALSAAELADWSLPATQAVIKGQVPKQLYLAYIGLGTVIGTTAAFQDQKRQEARQKYMNNLAANHFAMYGQPSGEKK